MAIGTQNQYVPSGSIGLMYMEPKLPPVEINDELSRRTEAAFQREFKEFGGAWRGCHQCSCGQMSSNVDFKFGQFTTNSLLPHYVRSHRQEISAEDMKNLMAMLAIAEGKASSIYQSPVLSRPGYKLQVTRNGQPVTLRKGNYWECAAHQAHNRTAGTINPPR